MFPIKVNHFAKITDRLLVSFDGRGQEVLRGEVMGGDEV